MGRMARQVKTRVGGVLILMALLFSALLPRSPLGNSTASARGLSDALPQRAAASSDTLFNQTDSRGRKQGFWKKYYRNGQVAYRAQFRDDRPVGRTRRYNEKGVLIADLQHSERDGLSRAKIYDDDGHLIAVGNFRNQLKDSIWTLYSGRHVVAREGYKNGEKDGAWERYSDEGVLATREHWRKGKLEGRQERYFADGRLQSFWTARGGVEDGPAVTLYTSGRPKLKGQFVNGLREGQWVMYDVDGKAQDTLVFERGRLIKGSLGGDADSALHSIYKNAGKLKEPMESRAPYGSRGW